MCDENKVEIVNDDWEYEINDEKTEISFCRQNVRKICV